MSPATNNISSALTVNQVKSSEQIHQSHGKYYITLLPLNRKRLTKSQFLATNGDSNVLHHENVLNCVISVGCL